MNSRISPKERGLIKGALRRVFARSDLRRRVIDASIIEHSDPSRPKVKKWCLCNVCKKPEAKSYCVVDHRVPLIPIDSSFEEIGADELLERLWCTIDNLQTICPSCHSIKTRQERQERAKLRPKKPKKRK